MRNVVIRAYADRNNEVVRELLANGAPLQPDQLSAITDIHIKVGEVCLKRSTGEILEADGVITVRLGDHVPPGVHKAYLTVFSLDKTDGEAWEWWTLIVDQWPVCAN